MEEGSPLLSAAAAAGSRAPLAEPCDAVRGRARGVAKPVAAISLGLAVYFVVAGGDRSRAADAQLTAAATERARGDLTFAVSRGNYPVPSSLAYYPWDHVAEPHVASTLTVYGDAPASALFRWRISRAGAVVFTGEGWAVRYNFTAVAREYNVTVFEDDDSASAHARRVVSGLVMCKYVRREIRKLTDDHRNAYFSAMSVVAHTDLEEGRARFGANFVNLVYETVKHVHGLSCSPFHGGLSFLTAHAAFTLELDRALQTIDPTVVTPYWDFTIDSEEHGVDWDESVVFSHDWFGAATPPNPSRQISGTYFNETPVPVSCEFEVHNAYCRVTDQRNEDPSPFATRAHELCGLRTDVRLPGCAELAECLQVKSLVDLHSCAEDVLHGNMHTVIGGFWDCPYDLGQLSDEHPEWKELLLSVGTRSINIWQATYGSKHLKCPSTCDSGADTWQTCHCHCPAFDLVSAQDGGATVDWIKGFFNETKILFFEDWHAGSRFECESGFNSPYVYKKYFDIQHKDDGKCDYSLRGFDNDENKEFLHFLAGYACSPGKVGSMSTGGSSNDPIFWPIHPSFDRLWSFMRLSPEYAGFDNGWPGDRCAGRSYEDLMPFRALQDDEAAMDGAGNASDPDHFYSNRELFKMFSPESSRLQYIYDDFDFSHCSDAIEASNSANSSSDEEGEVFTLDNRKKPTRARRLR